MSDFTQDFERASAALQQRRARAFEIQRHHKLAAYAAYPRLAQIETEMKQLGAGVARAMLEGDGGTYSLEYLRTQGDKLLREREEILRSANLPADYLLPQFTCKKCQDTGTFEGGRCQCFKDLILQVQNQRMSKTSPIGQCSFDNFDLSYYPDTPIQGYSCTTRQLMQNNLTYCKQYAAQFTTQNPSILMIGATGLGKTHLSLAIAGQVIAKGYNVVYGSFQNFANAMEHEHFGSGEEATLQSLLTCDLLILDDVGSEFSTTFVTASLYHIINTRMVQGLPTIVNTNLGYEQLRQRYDARITSRLIGAFTRMDFLGDDIRIQKAKQR